MKTRGTDSIYSRQIMDLNEYRMVYQDLQNKQLLKIKDEFNPQEFLKDMSDFQKQEKYTEGNFAPMESRLRFYQFMGQDPDTWPSKEEADLAFKESSEKLKAECKLMDKEKEKVEKLIENTVDEYEQLQKKLQLVGERLQIIEGKKTKLEGLKAKQRQVLARLDANLTSPADFYAQKKQQGEKLAKVVSAIELCQTTIGRVGEERRGLEETCQRLRHTWQSQQQQQQKENHVQLEHVRDLENNFNKKKELLAFVKQQSKVDIKERRAGEQVVLDLQSDKDGRDGRDIPRLFLTARVEQDDLDITRLTRAEETAGECKLYTDDILSDGLSYNDLPQLVTRLHHKWNTLFPMVEEMKTVSDRHAIDWIQDQNVLRILVGRGGSTMCTLHVPESYPYSGEITLQKTSNLPSDVREEDIVPPSDCRSLQGWVDYLENRFGKP